MWYGLFIALVACTVIQLLYAIVVFIRFARLPGAAPVPTANRQPVSVIICARNEAANLAAHLPLFLSQRYDNAAGVPLYEVIVVNDASTDDTAAVLREMAARYAHLKVVNIAHGAERAYPGKKHAVSIGASQATHKFLLLTDADCTPASTEWIKYMAAPLVAGKEIVLGYGGYQKRKGLLNAFVRWETVHTFMQYSGYALAGIPYMGVGRNMACTKTALDKAAEHPAWAALPSGDDDILVTATGTATNTAVVAVPAAFTYSAAPQGWGAWRRQKQRHTSTGKYYRKVPRLLLGIYALTHAAVWLLFFPLLHTPWYDLAIQLMAVRCLVLWLVTGITASRLGEARIFFLLPFFDIAWMMYNFAFLPFIFWKDKQQWT